MMKHKWILGIAKQKGTQKFEEKEEEVCVW